MKDSIDHSECSVACIVAACMCKALERVIFVASAEPRGKACVTSAAVAKLTAAG